MSFAWELFEMTAPLRLLQVVLSLTLGGTEKMVYDIVRHVDKSRIQPVICCLDEPGVLGDKLHKEGYPVYALNRKPGFNWEIAGQILRLVDKESIDIVNAQQYTPFVYAALARLHRMITGGGRFPRIVFTEHGINYPYKRKIKRYLLNPALFMLADEITTISKFTKSILVKYENYPASRMKVIYNGIAIDHFSKNIDVARKKESIGLQNDSKVIGIVARLDPVKNHPMLLSAFRAVLSLIHNAYLVVVGDGPENARLHSLAEEFNISKNTVFLGARTDISELIKTFDVFALPSLSEGMSITLIEAMAAGVPVVASSVGGNPEVVQDGLTGYLVPCTSEQELTLRLIECLENGELRTRMGTAAHERARNFFTIEKMVDAYTTLYLKRGTR